MKKEVVHMSAESLGILIVEDDLVDRMSLERLLAQSSLSEAKVRCAGCLREALDALGQGRFDIILSDLGLPDCDGMQTVAALQAVVPEVPLVILSGLNDEATAVQAVQQGAQDYLIKGQLDGHLLVRSIRYAIERKKAERARRVAEERYRIIFDNSAVAILLADEQERLVSWNRFTEGLLGMDGEDLRLRPIRSLYPDEEWNRIRACPQPQQDTQRHIETRMIQKRGGIIDVEVSLSVLKDAEGRVAGSISVIHDITEQRQVREVLRRKQRDLEAIFDAAPVGMLLVDDAVRVYRANDAIRAISGRDYPQIIRHLPGHVLGCAHAAADPSCCRGRCGDEPVCEDCLLFGTIRRSIESGLAVRGIEIQMDLRVHDRPVCPSLSISAEPIVMDGRKYAVVSLHDITARAKVERELREAMEMKSQFISTVSHELRTPLASMKEAVLIVLDQVAGPINEDQRHFLDVARRNIDRLRRLINDVLDFQKLGSGSMKFNMQEGDLAKVVEEAYGTMLPHATAGRVAMSLSLEPHLPKAVFDSDRIIQVVTNLLSNAIKFTPDGGKITLEVGRQDGQFCLRVRDTGLGIPKEALPRMFERFYRVQRPGREIKGTGLGLAIVKAIVEAHGGQIGVDSEAGQGTTFTVLLPMAPTTDTGPVLSGEDDALIEDAVVRG